MKGSSLPSIEKVVGVATLRVELVPADPGVTLAGAKLAVAPEGRPVTLKLTALVKDPPCGATWSV